MDFQRGFHNHSCSHLYRGALDGSVHAKTAAGSSIDHYAPWKTNTTFLFPWVSVMPADGRHEVGFDVQCDP